MLKSYWEEETEQSWYANRECKLDGSRDHEGSGGSGIPVWREGRVEDRMAL